MHSYFSYLHTMRKKRAPLPFGKPTFYGSTTVGARGQVVIPIKARRNLKLKTGEELLVSGTQGRFLMMMKMNELKGIAEELSARVREFEAILVKKKK